MTNITELLIIVGIGIAIFFLFRGINLWYWKINNLIKNQERQETLMIDQNDMLRKIFTQLGGKIGEKNQQRKNSELSSVDGTDKEIVEDLKKDIKNDELIVKIKQNGRIEKWKKADWDEIMKIGNQDKFDLIYCNEP